MRTPRGYRMRQNPRRSSGGGTPSWLIPALLVGGAGVVFLMMSKGPAKPVTNVATANVNPWGNIIGGVLTSLTKLTSPGAPAATAAPKPAAASPVPGIVTSLDGYSF